MLNSYVRHYKDSLVGLPTTTEKNYLMIGRL